MEFNKKSALISLVISVLIFTGGLFGWENNQSIAIAEIRTDLQATKIYQQEVTRRQDELDNQMAADIRWIKNFLINNYKSK
jgi:predicted negative regulator of RcsB-dependent stress response